MFAMFQQIFAAVGSFFMAFEKAGKAAVHLTTWAEESAATIADEARVKRAAALVTLNKENNLTIEATK